MMLLNVAAVLPARKVSTTVTYSANLISRVATRSTRTDCDEICTAQRYGRAATASRAVLVTTASSAVYNRSTPVPNVM